MKKKVSLYIFLISIFLIMPFISGQHVEINGGGSSPTNNIVLENNLILITENNKLHALKIDASYLWVWNDEGNIIYSEFINDLNSDTYNEVLVISNSFVMPSTKILDGKTGQITKLFPLTTKTYKNNYPTTTSNVAVKNNKIILSNFKRIYEILGSSINKKLDFQGFVKGLAILNNHIIVTTNSKISFYDLNSFNELGSKETDLQQPNVFFGDSNFILIGRPPRSQSDQIEIYNSDLVQKGIFSISRDIYNAKFFVFDNEIAMFNKNSKKLKIYGFSGNIKKEINNVETAIESSDKLYYFLSDSKDVMEINPSTNIEQKLFNISSEINTQGINLLNKDYFIIKEQNNLKLYNKNNLIGSYNLASTTKSVNIGGTDFLIKTNYPFNYIYKGIKGEINLADIEDKSVISINEVGDLNSDGTKEILIGFSGEESYYGLGEQSVNAFVLLNTKTKSINKISFIPTEEELNQTIDDLQTQITSTENSINNKNDDINDLYNQINRLDPATNQSEINNLNQEIEDLNSEINNLNDEKRELENQLQNYQSGGFEYQNRIRSYAIFDNGKKLFIMLSNDKYVVDLLTLEKTKKEIFPEISLEFLANIGDINFDNYKDIMFIDYRYIGVFSGKDYNLLWKKNITKDYGIEDIQGKWSPKQSNFVVVSYQDNNEKVLGKINSQEETFSELTRSQEINFLTEVDGNLIFDFHKPNERKVFVIMNTGQTIELDMEIWNQQTSFQEFSPVVFYDCNNDNKKDILYVSFEQRTPTSKEFLRKGGGSQGPQQKLICLDIGTKTILKEIPEFKFQGQEMKIINNYLFIKENIIYVLDLNNFEIVSGILEVPYNSGTGLMDKDENQITIIDKDIITIPSDGANINGDFELSFNSVDEIIITKADNVFYDSTLENQQLIKLKQGSHNLEASYFDLQNKQYVLDNIDVTIQRPKSILPYFAILIALAVIALGILKWIKKKR